MQCFKFAFDAKSFVVRKNLNLVTRSFPSLWWITAARTCACGRAVRCTRQRASVRTCDWSNQVSDVQHSFSRRMGFRAQFGLIPLRETQCRGTASYSAWGIAATRAWTRAGGESWSEVLVGHSLWCSHRRWRFERGGFVSFLLRELFWLATVARAIVRARELARFFTGKSLDGYNFGVWVWYVRDEARVWLFKSGHSWCRRCRKFTKRTTVVCTRWCTYLKGRNRKY